MRTLIRCLGEFRVLWRIWLPLLALAALLPPVVLAMPLVEKWLIDGVVLPGRLDLVPQAIAIYAALWVVTTVTQVVSSGLRGYLGEQLTLQLRQRLFRHTEVLSLAFARREHSGRTMALFVNDVPSVTGLFSTTILGGVGSLVALAVGAAIMFGLNWRLAVVAALLPLLVAGLAGVVTRPLRPAARRAQEKAAELSERLQENLAGIREIVAFGQGASQERRFAATLNELMRLRMRVTLTETAINAGQSAFAMLVNLAILGYGAYLVIQGQTTLGTLVAMRTLFGYVSGPAGNIFGLFGGVQKALGAADRVYAFLDETPRVQERRGARAPRGVQGTITFDRVTFAYSPGRPVLNEVSFTTRPGETIALVGPSGGGKSTLVSLIARFYDPIEGRVLLDGADLRDLELSGLRSQIAFVFQDTFLFATTVRENIAFGQAGANTAQIIAAARTANAWEFIQRLTNGLDTQVGERGVQLSEGQKQRLAIARAVLRDPRILILDEPTASLDARSEHLLQSALANLTRGRTTFVIAHRLATVRRADCIFVLDSGRIVEQGTHTELLQRAGLYRQLFELQLGRTTTGDTGSGVALAPHFVAPKSVAT